MTNETQVAVAILLDDVGRVLICQRPESSRYPLKWEFPGGKLRRFESHFEALARELREELSIEIADAALLHEAMNNYPDGGAFSVRYYLVTSWKGSPRNIAFNQMLWMAPEKVQTLDILDGNREICRDLGKILNSRRATD